MATPHPDPNLTPAMPAPPGQHSQLINPPSQNYPTIVCLVLAIVLSAIFVAIRFYTRYRITRKLWWDDWTCLLGWVFLVALAGLLLDGLNYGGGSDLWNVSKAKYAIFRKHFHNVEIVARVGMFFTKASILLFYQRLFVPPGIRWTRIWWAIWFVFWWNCLYAIALVLAVAFECVNKGAIVAEGKQCVDEYAVLICASVINVTTDLMILIIPIVAIWGLHMPAEKKWRLSAVFAVGTLGVAASVARLGYQIPEAKDANKTIIITILSLIKYFHLYNLVYRKSQWLTSPISHSTAEQFIGIVVSCMPILPAFYRHISSQLSQSGYQGTSGPSKNITSSMLGRRNDNSEFSRTRPRDPYPLDSVRGYEELNDTEAQRHRKGVGGIVRDVEMNVIVEHR